MSFNDHYLKRELHDLIRKDSSVFEFFMEGSFGGVWFRDLENGENEWVNPRFWTLLGYDPEEKKHLASERQELMHPDDFRASLDHFRKHCADPDHPYDRIIRYRHKNGATHRARCRGVAIRDENGKPVRMVGVHDDLTQLAQNEEKYRLLFDLGSDAMFLVDDETSRILECNAKASEIFGYSSEQLLSMGTADLSTTPQATLRACRQSVAKQERVYRTKDGRFISVEVTSEHFRLDGRAVHIAAIRDITERKHAEKALRESEERFHLAMDASKDGVYEWDLETLEIYYSPGWKRMLGYEPDELPDDFSVWETLTKPEDVEKSWRVMNELVAGKRERFEVEFEMRHKKGHWIHVLSRSNLYKDSKGKPVRVVGTHVDITESKRQKERLELAESRYRKAQELGKVGNWEYDLRTAEFWGSDEAKKIYGFDPDRDRFSAEEVKNRIPERNRVHRALMDLIEKGKPYDLEFDIVAEDTGKRKTMVSIAEMQMDDAGNPMKVSGVVQDITHRKQAENALENERRLLAAVFDNIEEAIVICDENGTLTRFNEAARKLHGPERPIMPDRWTECHNLYREDGTTPLPLEEIPLYRALRGEHVRNAEIVVVPRNGAPRFLVCNGQSLIDDAGRTIGAVAAMHDDTHRRMAEMEREKLQAQLNQAQKLESVGRLAGGVAHDFNNMLGVILGHAELALMRTDENRDLHSGLKEIQKAAQRSADLTKQLLAFARKQTISPRRLDLNDTVENMLNMLRRLIGEDIDLTWKPAAHLWPVKMDPTQIDQILANLCVNARDAIAGVGGIVIETRKITFDAEYRGEHPDFVPGDFVLLAVGDDGCGMDRETLDNLFEPFFTTKEVGRGTGLGLATIYGIVKQNNGFIDVHSEPGRGSTFKIHLPRLFAEDEAAEDAPGKTTVASGDETILLVEDEPAILRMARTMLERRGYSVLSAPTPAEALEMAKNHSGTIDLLMTDVVMPEMNGRDLAEKIASLHPGIKRLFMSGYTADIIARQGVLDDGLAFIQKPFSMKALGDKLREILDADDE